MMKKIWVYPDFRGMWILLIELKLNRKKKKKKSTRKSRVFQDVSSPVQGIGYLKFWVPRVEPNAQGFVDTSS